MFLDHLQSTRVVCAHRGARSLAPENTLLALEKAVACGADCWETDVQTSADGELVIFHDDTLERTTDVAEKEEFATRRPWSVDAFTLAELRGLDAGRWFLATDPFGTIAAGEVPEADFAAIAAQRIPTLREALLATRVRRFPMNLEIKDQPGKSGDLTIVTKVLELLRETGTEELVLLSSFNHAYLAETRRLNPALPTAALVEESHPDELVPYLRRLGVVAYHPDQAISDPELVRSVTAAGFRVNLWTVNDMERALAFFAAGATAVVTDFPQRLRRALQSLPPHGDG